MKKIKDRELDIKFSDKDYLEDVLIDYDITPEELCYQMTAYESDGIIDYDKGIKDILSEELDEPTFSDLTEYLEENNYDKIYSIEEFDDLESGEEPFTICQKVFYGDFNPGYHKYYSYDGNGNYKGYYDEQDAMDANPEVYDWYYSKKLEDFLTDEDFKEDIINGTLQLVKQGY